MGKGHEEVITRQLPFLPGKTSMAFGGQTTEQSPQSLQLIGSIERQGTTPTRYIPLSLSIVDTSDEVMILINPERKRRGTRSVDMQTSQFTHWTRPLHARPEANPPSLGERSTMVQGTPLSASEIAAEVPAVPLPMMSTPLKVTAPRVGERKGTENRQ
jgi:hypothetical protein